MTNGEKGQIEDVVTLLKGKFKELKMNRISWDSLGLAVIAMVKRLEKLIK